MEATRVLLQRYVHGSVQIKKIPRLETKEATGEQDLGGGTAAGWCFLGEQRETTASSSAGASYEQASRKADWARIHTACYNTDNLHFRGTAIHQDISVACYVRLPQPCPREEALQVWRKDHDH